MKKVMFTAIMAVGFLVAGCNRGSSGYEGEATPGSLKITIRNEPGNQTRARGVPAAADENEVHLFTVYVFDYSTGATERTETFTVGLEGTITGLSTASAKRVVVLVNDNSTNPADIGNYSNLVSRVFDIGTQDPADLSTNGLFMSGESSGQVTLSATAQTTAEIDVRRVAAKVILGSLTILANPATELDRFTVEGVSVQRVPVSAYMLGSQIPTLGDNDYRGGLNGSISTGLAMLNEAYSLPQGYTNGNRIEPEIYFYTFPNDNSNDKATMLTIHGTYDGVDMYYTFLINNIAGAQTDGMWIQRNKVYILNVTLQNLGLGGDDPDAVNALGDLIVDVEVVDWEGTLTQDVTW